MAKVIYNNIIPFKGFKAITIFPFVFARKKAKPLSDVYINHEGIHLSQQLEVLLASLIVVFLAITIVHISWWWMLATLPVYYIWYGMEYLIRSIAYRSWKEGYRNIAFEQEAYLNERDYNYITDRNGFAWIKYIFRKTYNSK